MIWVYFILVKWLYTFQPHPLNGGIDLSNPPDTVSLFFPGVVSDELGNRDMAISPNVDELFYTVQIRGVGLSAILHCKKLKHGTWSSPEVASFSGWASDLEPAFAPDGKRLFFSSNRSQKDKTKTDYDIWYVEKINDIWTSPRSLQAPINSDKNEFFPQITKSGNLYFTKEMEGKDEDIVVCKYINDLYQKPESLSDAINTTGAEFNAYIDPDERYIIFTGYKRKSNIGSGDLFISKKSDKGDWLPALPIANGINSKGITYSPYISPDGKILFFSSNRTIPALISKNQNLSQLKEIANSPGNGNDDIYWISTKLLGL